MGKTANEIRAAGVQRPGASDGADASASGTTPERAADEPAEPLERARLLAEVARQRVRIAKEELKRARKRVKEAKREAKRARKQAASTRKAWKKARKAHRAQPTAEGSTGTARKRTMAVANSKAAKGSGGGTKQKKTALPHRAARGRRKTNGSATVTHSSET